MKGYGLVDREVMRNRNISLRAKGLYGYLCSMAGARGMCYPSRRTACHYLCICDSTLTNLLGELVTEGAVKCEKKRGKNGTFQRNRYIITAVSTVHGDDLHGDAVHDVTVTDTNPTNINNK